MDFAFELLSVGGDQPLRLIEDVVDRIHRKLAPGIMLLSLVLIMCKQFLFQAPIDCKFETQYKAGEESYALSWQDFTNSYCWVTGTYYVPLSHDAGLPQERSQRNYISYYQWVPIALVVQAVMFTIPYLIWEFLSERSNLDLQDMISAANRLRKHSDFKSRKIIRQFLVFRFKQYFQSHSLGGNHSCVPAVFRKVAICGKDSGVYLATMYLVFKTLMVVNCFAQLLLMKTFLGVSSADMFDLLDTWVQAKESSKFGPAAFPKMTFCDVDFRVLNNIQTHTVQCVLTINYLNEKIYIFIWFSCMFLVIVTALNIVIWAAKLLVSRNGYEFVYQHFITPKFLDISVLCLDLETEKALEYEGNTVGVKSLDGLDDVENTVHESVDFESDADGLDAELRSGELFDSRRDSSHTLFSTEDRHDRRNVRPDDQALDDLFKELDPNYQGLNDKDNTCNFVRNGSAARLVKKQRVELLLSYLKTDGVFLLRLVGSNVNATVVTEMLTDLWTLVVLFEYRRKLEHATNIHDRHP